MSTNPQKTPSRNRYTEINIGDGTTATAINNRYALNVHPRFDGNKFTLAMYQNLGGTWTEMHGRTVSRRGWHKPATIKKMLRAYVEAMSEQYADYFKPEHSLKHESPLDFDNLTEDNIRDLLGEVLGDKALDAVQAENCEPTNRVGFNGACQNNVYTEWNATVRVVDQKNRAFDLTAYYYTTNEEDAKMAAHDGDGSVIDWEVDHYALLDR